MFGEDIGQLNVYVRFYSNGPLKKSTVYQVNSMFPFYLYSIILLGERGNAWIRHELKLNYTTPFQVLIEGVVGISFLSDIGLDDTVFTPECDLYSYIRITYNNNYIQQQHQNHVL